MALWMTVEQEWFGLAALLLVFSCAFWHGCKCGAWGRGKDKGRLAAFFVVSWIGAVAGCGRVEYEEWRYSREQDILREYTECSVQVAGRIVEIQETDYGMRLVLQDCELGVDDENVGENGQRNGADQREQIKQHVNKLYCYINGEPDQEGELELGVWIFVNGNCELPEPDRNPGGFDYRLYCFSKGICGTVNAESVLALEVNGSKERSETGEMAHGMQIIYWRFREHLRQFGILLESKLDLIAEPEDAGILKAVLLGVKSDMSDEVYELYRLNGISHVLAISGLHVSVVGKGLWNLLRKLGCGYAGAGIAVFVLLLLYGTMIGFGPSVVRAIFMMGVSFLASVYGRTYDLPSAMCVPAIVLLLYQPYILTQAGFQLSFLAVGAMFFPGNYLAKRLELKGFTSGLFTSVALQAVTLPVVLWHSFETPLYGILLNLLVVPLMTYVLVSGILAVAGSFVWSGLGTICVGGAHYILWLYKSLCVQMLNVPGANLVLGRPEWMEMVFYYGCLLIGAWLAGRKTRARWLVLWIVGILVLIPRPQYGLFVTFLDVGQGDGIYMEAGTKNMLVDCGSSQKRNLGEDVLVPYLKSRGVDRIDTVVVSHGDSDHVSGIRYLLEGEMEIGRLILPRLKDEDEACMQLAELADARGIPVLLCDAGDSLQGLLGEDIMINCLNPDETQHGDRNENSLVLELQYGQFRMMLTGDAGVEAEKEVMEKYHLEPVTVLKAGHHGSNTSSGEAFLEALDPMYVILSYGEGNTYGHPAPNVVERCEKVGAEIYETAKSGAITVWTDGERMKIEEWMRP